MYCDVSFWVMATQGFVIKTHLGSPGYLLVQLPSHGLSHGQRLISPLPIWTWFLRTRGVCLPLLGGTTDVSWNGHIFTGTAVPKVSFRPSGTGVSNSTITYLTISIGIGMEASKVSRCFSSSSMGGGGRHGGSPDASFGLGTGKTLWLSCNQLANAFLY